MEKLFFRGRYKKHGKSALFFNTGSGVSLLAKGSSIVFELASLNKPCFVYIIKDFDYNQKEKFLITNEGRVVVKLEEGKITHIDLVKSNEAIDNTLVLKNIIIDGKILKYIEKPNKFIKVYGDSTVAGYGILEHQGTPDYDTSDGVEDFCFRALYNLKVDYDIFSGSGWGITFSPYTDPMNEGIEKYQDCVCVKNDEKWSSKKKPDLLLLSLGTNDFSYINQSSSNKEELEAQFIASYRKFIEKERKISPNVPILMVYGTLKEDCVYPLIEKTFKEMSKVFNNLYVVKLPGDNDGIDFHCHVSHHKEMAEVLEQKIISIII